MSRQYSRAMVVEDTTTLDGKSGIVVRRCDHV